MLVSKTTSYDYTMSDTNFLYHTAYLAPVSFYSLLCSDNSVILDDKEYFEKQSYRNRCRIMTANGKMDLIIPVVKGASSQTRIRDVRIAEHDNWQLRHWRALKAAYSSSPFFEYYEDDLYPFYSKKWDFLWDYNTQLQNLLLDLLDVESKVELHSLTAEIEMYDVKGSFHPSSEAMLLYPDQVGNTERMESKFVHSKPYFQVFERKFGFQPNLSIVDMLFNLGPESVLYLS